MLFEPIPFISSLLESRGRDSFYGWYSITSKKKSFSNFKILKAKQTCRNHLDAQKFMNSLFLEKAYNYFTEVLNFPSNFNQDKQFKQSNLFISTFQNLENSGMLQTTTLKRNLVLEIREGQKEKVQVRETLGFYHP